MDRFCEPVPGTDLFVEEVHGKGTDGVPEVLVFHRKSENWVTLHSAQEVLDLMRVLNRAREVFKHAQP